MLFKSIRFSFLYLIVWLLFSCLLGAEVRFGYSIASTIIVFALHYADQMNIFDKIVPPAKPKQKVRKITEIVKPKQEQPPEDEGEEIDYEA